jgi:hypothetical protein
VPDWRTLLVLTHRWLGITGCVLFAAWFVSGIAMMYVRMPVVAGEELLARAEPIDLSNAQYSAVEAADLNGLRLTQVQAGMLQGRPAWFFGGRDQFIVFADTGEFFLGLDGAGAAEVARRWAPAGVTPRYDAYVTEPDQWTLQTRLPVHRFAFDDDADTYLYVSEITGDVVQRTTARERVWAYLGPVLHWLYFTPLRRDGALWTEVVVWSSLIGCFMCLTGLLWGAMRLSPFRRFRIRGAQAMSPYTGMMKWHHYAGLIFGVITLTWAYSGLLSMGPFNWFVSRGFTPEQREATTGGPLRTDLLTLDSMRAALEVYEDQEGFVPRRLDVLQVQGEPFWTADRPPGSPEPWLEAGLLPRAARPQLEPVYVSAVSPGYGPRSTFDRGAMEAIAGEVMAGVPVRDAVWLDAYDGYYYDVRGQRPLPVLRVRYLDEVETWLYLDPTRGGVVQRSERTSRRLRWLYQGLHSLDFPFLYFERPAWDLVVIGLSLGGTVLSVTTMLPAWRRLRAHARGAVRRLRRSRGA